MKAGRETIGEFDVRVWRGGDGAPLLYLHGFEQHPGTAPYLDRLAQTHTVLAPEHPGYGSSTGIESLRDIHDVSLYYRGVLERWGAGPVTVVGHSLGGMFAAELAVLAPQWVQKLVLISPYGLWLDALPLPDPFVLGPPALAKAKWCDPAIADRETSAFDAAGGDSPAAYRTINLTTASKFMWPIPDRGLSRRLRYLASPTLVIHGGADGLIPAAYEKAWTGAAPRVRTAQIAKAGHLPMVEAEDDFISLVKGFTG
jgi:pimeloyl-ACP methyl ester carboxylesterase